MKGDIQANTERHLRLIDLAIAAGADLVIFPELSLTSYEPELAGELAIDPDDTRLDVFQGISDTRQVTIGLGAPVRGASGICISLVLFEPQRPRRLYSKKYLHPDEKPFFVSGDHSPGLIGPESNIALAICYELSVPGHPAAAHRSGAEIYLASVAKSAEGVGKASQTLAAIARRYSMTVLMANCLGPCDNFLGAGRSSVWNKQGTLVGQLDDSREGVLVFDTITQTTTDLCIGA